MLSNSYAPSVADIAAVTNGNCNGYQNGWDNDWWAWIILMALFGGFGNRGFGGGFIGGNSCYTPATCAEVQNGFNNANVQSMLNGIENGICSLGYDQLNQMNGINQNISTVGNNIVSAITNMGINQMQNTNALATQLSNCCCETREAIQGVNYNMAQQFCNLGNTVQNIARDITDNQNANYRALHEELVNYRMQDKDDTIAELRSQVQALNLGISQRNQNDYLVGQLRPCPTPAYVVPNPFCCNTQTTCGCGNGCC